jgi:hypothetical protein
VKTKKTGGGTAVGGGINFQAAVTAIAGVHLLRGTPLDWFPVADVPVAVRAESEGAGDDVHLELKSGNVAEVQAKKGLRRGAKLWEALEGLIEAVKDGHLKYGALAVAPDSSRTIWEDLAKDLERFGQGRSDHLTEIGAELHRRLQRVGGNSEHACHRVTIRVVHALKADGADISAAKELLRGVCADEAQANHAWNALYRDAVALIEHRGRWTMAHLLRLLQREGIAIRDADFPAAIATKLAQWVRSTRNNFTLQAARKRLPLSALLEMRVVGTVIEQPDAEDAAAALARYHDAAGALDRDAPVYDAEWTGRFRRHAVVVAGPGLGKSTLMTLLASSYATDGFPVLGAKLKPIAAAMERGDSFDHALRSQALDGSGITPERFDSANLNGLVVLADGLDDCGGSHEAVARALHDFAWGHPSARIIVTTRPIGYTTAALADWKHYRLLAPDKNHGAVNLAKLLSALEDSDDTAEDAFEVAKRELAASRAAAAISSSPHLLGMAAALISSRGKLPNTRPQLYSKLVGLFETARQATASCPVSPQVAARLLNGLGWLLMHDSLASADVLSERCAELLAEPMGRTPMAMFELLEPVLRYWEQLGIIEQLHHDGAAYWTFVHKTFTEFTAARYLKALPDEQRAAHLDRLVDQPDWHEVIAFAGGLGLGDEIARLLVERRASGYSGQMERALALAGDRDSEVTDGLVRQLATLAFQAVAAEGGDRFSVGLALSDLTEAHPEIVGPIAATYLHDERSAVQLAAWACVVSAEPNSYGADELAQVLRRLLSTVSKDISASLLGGIRLGGDKDRDLIRRIALAALSAQPDADLKAFVETHLGHEALGTWGFQREVTALLSARGVAEEVKLPWARSWASSAFALLNPPDEWRRASSRALRALAEAVVAEHGETGGTSPEPPWFPNFGALVALTGFNEVSARDVYRWEEPYNAVAMRAVVKALVHASAIDPQALSAEAASVVRRADADADDGFGPFDPCIPQVDVPKPDWRKAAARIPDRATLVAAMNHGSDWMAYVAGNILAAASATQEQSRSLLDDAAGTSLWAATEVVREQQPADVANALILDRLAGSLPDGAEHLFKGLEKGRVERSPALCEALRRGLASVSPTIAIAAANLAKDMAERGQPLEPKVIVDAYDNWLVRESEPKGRVIPPSPRETLLKLLISQNALDDDRLLATLSDIRSDVSEAGKEHMLDAIATSQPLKDAVIERIVSRSLPPAIAASVLRREATVSDEQIRALETLLREQNPKWRRAGVELLRRCYLSAHQVAEHGAKLSADDEGEIRRAVEKRLAAAAAV